MFHWATQMSGEPPGRPQLLQGTLLKESIYDRAMRERETQLLPKHVSGVICICGHLRTFGEPSVYQKLRANVDREPKGLGSASVTARSAYVWGARGMACPHFHSFSWHLPFFPPRKGTRHQVIDSLRFSELWVLLITEFGGVDESKNPSRSWKHVAPALEELQPDAGQQFRTLYNDIIS